MLVFEAVKNPFVERVLPVDQSVRCFGVGLAESTGRAVLVMYVADLALDQRYVVHHGNYSKLKDGPTCRHTSTPPRWE